MKLYGVDWSPYFARVAIVIAAKGLAIETAPPPGGSATSDAFRKLSPLGKMPLLDIEDGTCLPESTVIMEYLEDRFPEPSLQPATAYDRARAQLIGRCADLYLAPSLLPFFRQLFAGTRDEAENPGRLVALQKSLADIEHYVDGGPYLIGDRLSLADAALAPSIYYVASVVPLYVDGDPLAATPKLGAWWKHVARDRFVGPVLQRMDVMFRASMEKRKAS